MTTDNDVKDQRNSICVRCDKKFWHPLGGEVDTASSALYHDLCSECLTTLRTLARDVGFLPRVERTEHES